MPPGVSVQLGRTDHLIIKGSLGFKGPRQGCLRCLPEALDIAPPPSPAKGRPGPARSRHSSRADGLGPARPGQGVRAPPGPPGARRAAWDPAAASGASWCALPTRPGTPQRNGELLQAALGRLLPGLCGWSGGTSARGPGSCAPPSRALRAHTNDGRDAGTFASDSV